MRRWAARRKAARELAWARERAADTRFAVAQWRAYTRKESQKSC